MIDKELFDKLDGLAKRIRDKKREPFGGIQVGVPRHVIRVTHSL